MKTANEGCGIKEEDHFYTRRTKKAMASRCQFIRKERPET